MWKEYNLADSYTRCVQGGALATDHRSFQRISQASTVSDGAFTSPRMSQTSALHRIAKWLLDTETTYNEQMALFESKLFGPVSAGNTLLLSLCTDMNSSIDASRPSLI